MQGRGFRDSAEFCHPEDCARIHECVGDAAFYLHDAPQALRFEVRGAVSAEVAQALEQSLRTALSILNCRPLIIDLRRAPHVDAEAQPLLAGLSASGARLLVGDELLAVVGASTKRQPELAGQVPLPRLRRWWCRLLRALHPRCICGSCNPARIWSL